jgi:hypothetical protein
MMNWRGSKVGVKEKKNAWTLILNDDPKAVGRFLLSSRFLLPRD